MIRQTLAVLFGSTESCSGMAWDANEWLKLLAGFVAGVIVTILGAKLTAKGKEFFWRLTRWEPYSEKLWQKRSDFYPRLIAASRDAMQAAHDYTFAQANDAKREVFSQTDRNLRALYVECVTVASNGVLNIYKAFVDRLYLYANSSESRIEKHEKWQAIISLYEAMADAARMDLFTERLDEEARNHLRQSVSGGSQSDTQGA